jgi:predicted transglutaminase-like cysteine proteinase
MRALVCTVSALACFVMSGGSAVAESSQYQPSYMRMYGPSHPPYGFVRYCEANDKACSPSGSPEQRLNPTPQSLSELDDVNRAINAAIAPATDNEIYGVSEYWTIPEKRGDCEDYTLLKQKVLIQHGWPSSALLLTVVRDEKGEGHAVLTARTSQGDFVLDNKVDEVKLWNKTGYQFVMRQSYIEPKVWVSLDPASSSPMGALAGVGAGQ